MGRPNRLLEHAQTFSCFDKLVSWLVELGTMSMCGDESVREVLSYVITFAERDEKLDILSRKKGDIVEAFKARRNCYALIERIPNTPPEPQP